MADIETLFEVYPRDPLATVRLGLRVNDLVYGRLDGRDAVSGVLAGSEREQVEASLRKLVVLLEDAGGARTEAVTVVLGSEASRGLVAEASRSMLSDPVPALTEVKSSLADGLAVELHCVARAGASQGADCEPISAASGGPMGYRVGPVLVAPMIGPHDTATGELQGEDQESQVRAALVNAGRFLAAAGSGWHEVAQATFFMNPIDMPSLNAAWAEVFPVPEDRAPHKYVPLAMPEGQMIAVQILAIPGAPSRQVIELEHIRHGDWMTMAARTGDAVTSSRIIAKRDEDAAVYAGRVLDGIETVMAEAGGSLRDLTQVTAFIGDSAYREVVEADLRGRLGAGVELPRMNYIEANLGGVKAPRMEILGLIR